MVIGEEFVRVHIGQFAEFINIFNIADMARVYLCGGNSGIYAFVMLPVIQAGQQYVTAAQQHTAEKKEENHTVFGEFMPGMEENGGGESKEKKEEASAFDPAAGQACKRGASLHKRGKGAEQYKHEKDGGFGFSGFKGR